MVGLIHYPVSNNIRMKAFYGRSQFMNNKVLRAVAAVCFVPSLISSIQTFIYGKTYTTGEVLQIALALIPVVAAALIVIGALAGKPAICAVGAILNIPLSCVTVINNLSMLSTEIPDAVRSNLIYALATTCILLLGMLFLVLACFMKDRATLFGTLSAAMFLIRFIMALARGGITRTISGTSILPILAFIGHIAGPILISRFVVSRKTAKEE